MKKDSEVSEAKKKVDEGIIGSVKDKHRIKKYIKEQKITHLDQGFPWARRNLDRTPQDQDRPCSWGHNRGR